MAKTKAKKAAPKKATAAKKVTVSAKAMAKAKAIAPAKGAAPAKVAQPTKPSALAPGMPWITPYLIVKDPAAAIAFYEKAFGFTTRFKHTSPDGKIQHAEVAHNTGVLMLGPENCEHQCKAPSTLSGSPVSLYVYVENVDAVTENAKNAGGNVTEAPKEQFWGDRTSCVTDPEGHSWCLATHVKDVTPEELAKAAQGGCCDH